MYTPTNPAFILRAKPTKQTEVMVRYVLIIDITLKFIKYLKLIETVFLDSKYTIKAEI